TGAIRLSLPVFPEVSSVRGSFFNLETVVECIPGAWRHVGCRSVSLGQTKGGTRPPERHVGFLRHAVQRSCGAWTGPPHKSEPEEFPRSLSTRSSAPLKRLCGDTLPRLLFDPRS